MVMLFSFGSMYRFFSLLFIFGIAGPVLLAQNDPGLHERAFAILEERGEIVIEFFSDDVSTVKKINTFLSVDRRTSRGFEAYANEPGFRNFLNYNIPFRLVERQPRKKSKVGDGDFPGNWDMYPTHYQYVSWMNDLAGSNMQARYHWPECGWPPYPGHEDNGPAGRTGTGTGVYLFFDHAWG